jgi:hypothetical protein
MKIITLAVSLLLSVFSTVIMSYITMATPIGPWIAPTLVLFATIIFKVGSTLFYKKRSFEREIALATAAGSVGGILATGFGFSFPAIFFLNAPLFAQWMSSPFYFASFISVLACAAGAFGLWIADMFQDRFIVEQQLPFPIGELVYKMIAAQNQLRKAYELLVGFLGAVLFSIAQDGIAFCKNWVPTCVTKSIIPKSIILFNGIRKGALAIPALSFDLFPFYWAIGFVTGHVIMIPLAVGALSKILVVDTINYWWFPAISSMDFLLAFASGMVLSGTITGMLNTPKTLFKGMKNLWGNKEQKSFGFFAVINKFETIVVAALIIGFFTYSEFSLMSQLYLIILTFICTYQMVTIAGKIGLAQLGRFATFVMVPAIFIFKLTTVQLIMLSTFVEVCGGVAVDILHGRKIGQLATISKREMKRYQLFGLVISSLTVGVVFWLLIQRFGLGTPELFAQKAYSRALLIQSGTFDWYVLAVGFVFGYLLKFINMNPMLVLGGLLAPLNTTIGLITGGLFTLLTKEPEEWYPFWSGIFAASSIWMVAKALF